MFRRFRERSRGTALELLGGRAAILVDERANFFGVESAGVGQWRGNGCLAASDETIAFALWLPRRTLVVDRGSVVGVDTVRSHLGKSVGRQLLRVRFGGDAAAWYVTDLERWLAVLGGVHSEEA